MKPLRILLVDDEPWTVQLVRKILQADGHDVFEALDGEQAIEMYYRTKPDLVLLDVVIPKMDGLGVLAEIRRTDNIVGIIMISALTSEQLAVKSMQGGADDYVGKPFRLKTIRLHIQQVMEKVRLRRQNATLQDELIAVNEKLRHYMADPLIERLMASPSLPYLGGEYQTVTVLFMDFCNYTPLAYLLPPDEVLHLLNEYFDIVATSVIDNGGFVDKILGDGFMALFNVPSSLQDHATMAVLSAIDMRKRVQQYACHHKQPLDLRIGIHTGEAVVGNIGTPHLMNYTAIGDTVNLAKRLEESGLDGQILVSYDTYSRLNCDLLGDDLIHITPYQRLIFKGRTEPVEVYQIVGLDGEADTP